MLAHRNAFVAFYLVMLYTDARSEGKKGDTYEGLCDAVSGRTHSRGTSAMRTSWTARGAA